MRLVAILGLVLIAATLIPLSPSEAWWVRAFDYPRLQLTGLLAVWLISAFLIRMHRRPIARLVMAAAADWLDLYCVHPRPPYPSEATESTPRDAELVLLGREVRGKRGPVVVMGDLNDVGWSATSRLFVRTSRLLDPRVGRGFYNTFPATVPLFRFPIDYFFHSDDLRLVAMKRLRKFGSDHFPLMIHLSYEPPAERVQEAPAPKPGDEATGEQKIRKAK